MAIAGLSQSQLDTLKANIRQKESSNNYQVVNQLGYVGAYQMGAASLVDVGYVDREAYNRASKGPGWQKEFLANPNNWKTQGGLQGYLNSPSLQDQAYDSLTNRNYRSLTRLGVIDENSNPNEVSGYLATSHLLGPGGARDLKDGKVGRDANGTSAREYFEIGQSSAAGELRQGAVTGSELQGRQRSETVVSGQGSSVENADAQTIQQLNQSEANQLGLDAQETRQVNQQINEDNSRPPSSTSAVSAGSGSPAVARRAGTFNADISQLTINPTPNPLSNFSSYTYNISLFIMGVKGYVDLMRSESSSPLNTVNKTQKILVARSGGTGPDVSENFDIDFFIDDLDLQGVTAPNNTAGNTNTVDIKFTIREPNGVTLLERLKRASDSLEEGVNYINTPYLLQIQFKGYDELGAEAGQQIPPAYVPLKITDIKFEITVGGAEYKVTGVPFHQNVFGSINNTIPLNIQVKAGTVKDIFTSSVSIFEKEEAVDENDQVTGDTVARVTGEAKNLADAITKYNENTTKPTVDDTTGKTIPPNAEEFDEVEFVTADIIGQAKLRKENLDMLNTNMETAGKAFKQYANAIKGTVEIDTDSEIFKVNAGTGIINLINFIVSASDYMERNIFADGVQPGKNKSVEWFKIKPKITGVKGWDRRNGRYKFKIRYDVIPSTVYYSDYPYAPNSKPLGKGYHKEYEYIFTGQNTEVEDISLKYNVAYFQTQQFGTGVPNDQRSLQAIDADVVTTKNTTTASTQSESIKSKTTVESKRSQDLMSTILNEGADQIELKMDILGDPTYLPTGDSFFQKDEIAKKLNVSPYYPDGTINTDLTVPHVNVKFRTPTDYDDYTGYADPNVNKKYGSSLFNGIYKLIQVRSTFSGGRFTQKLEMVRVKIQPKDVDRIAENAKVKYNNTPVNNAEGEIVPVNPNTGVKKTGAAKVVDLVPALEEVQERKVRLGRGQFSRNNRRPPKIERKVNAQNISNQSAIEEDIDIQTEQLRQDLAAEQNRQPTEPASDPSVVQRARRLEINQSKLEAQQQISEATGDGLELVLNRKSDGTYFAGPPQKNTGVF